MTLKVLFLTPETARWNPRGPKLGEAETTLPGNPSDRPRHDTPKRKKEGHFFTIFYLLNAE